MIREKSWVKRNNVTYFVSRSVFICRMTALMLMVLYPWRHNSTGEYWDPDHYPRLLRCIFYLLHVYFKKLFFNEQQPQFLIYVSMSNCICVFRKFKYISHGVFQHWNWVGLFLNGSYFLSFIWLWFVSKRLL